MFVQNRDDARRYFIEVRRKHQGNQPLDPLEQLILGVILVHPEYHDLLDSGEAVLAADFSSQPGMTNPFLHMSMHIAIKEQIQTDRPAGIRKLCQALLDRCGDAHEMEHQVMHCLGESLWQAQRNDSMPDERAYLENLKTLL